MPGKSHEPRSLVGYSPWSRKESDMTKQLDFTSGKTIKIKADKNFNQTILSEEIYPRNIPISDMYV